MVRCRFQIIMSLIVLIIVVSGILGRGTSMNIMKIEIADVTVKSVDSSGLDYGDYTIDESLRNTILTNVNQYRYLYYKFEAKNLSKNAEIIFVDLQPIFSNAMVRNVVYYDTANDVPTSTLLNLYPEESRNYFRQILIKRNGLTDDELIQLAQGDKFKVSYSTNRWYSIFGILPTKKVTQFIKQ